MHSLFFSKVPVNEPHPGSPTGPLWREILSTGPFYISLKFLIKISLKEENFPSLKCPWKGTFLHVSQKRGPYGNKRPYSEPYLAYPSGSSVKESSLQIPLIELPQTETLHL